MNYFLQWTTPISSYVTLSFKVHDMVGRAIFVGDTNKHLKSTHKKNLCLLLNEQQWHPKQELAINVCVVEMAKARVWKVDRRKISKSLKEFYRKLIIPWTHS